MRKSSLLAIIALGSLLLSGLPAAATKLENPIAVFAALDKVTARIAPLEIPINETKTFGALRVTPRVCYSRPPTETPKTTAFVEVDETLLDGSDKRIFTGWMFAESPGLNAVEHPVFDVWLTGCKDPNHTAEVAPDALPGDQAGESNVSPPRRHRRRRIRQ